MNSCSNEVADYLKQQLDCDKYHTAQLDKAKAIFDSFLQQAYVISQIRKDYPGFKPKRIFPKRDKSKGKKGRRYQAMYKIMVATRMANIQRMIIQSQPIPKYHERGGITTDGLAIVGQGRTEIIVSPAGEIDTIPDGKINIAHPPLPLEYIKRFK